MSKYLAIILLVGACGSDNDPCAGATSGETCLWAGTGTQGYNRENEQLDRWQSLLDLPTNVTFGPDGRAYIDDWNNHMIRRVEKDDTLTRVVGDIYEGDGDPQMQDRLPVCNPAGYQGSYVALNHPTSTTFGPDGLLYIAAWHNNKIRVFDTDSGIDKTLAGDFYGFSGDGSAACMATFNQPSSIAFAPDGTMYTSDQRNVRIRMITPAPASIITTIAGTGVVGNGGDGGPALQAQFGWDTADTPQVSGWVVLDTNDPNLLYVADSANNRIRRIHLDTGIIDCIAGSSAQAGYSGDGGPAIDATFNWPLGLAMGPDGNLYVADRNNNVIRKIDLTTGIVTTVVGDGSVCNTATQACPDHVSALAVEMNQPYSVSFDATGNMYVADTQNNRILKVMK